jgi:energy-coupling factor transporter ATP-binding protein EcfA2
MTESNKKIVLLCGQAGSGKDTIATMIENLIPGQVKRVALADPLKEFARAVFLFEHRQLWGPSEFRNALDTRAADPRFWHASRERLWNVGAEFVREWAAAVGKKPPGDAVIVWFDLLEEYATFNREFTPRLVLQTLGTDFGRRVLGSDVWARLALSRIARTEEQVNVVTDGRFANEVEIFEAARAKIVRVYDVESEPIPIVQHESERGLLDVEPGRFHALIHNRKSQGLEALKCQVRDMLEGFGWIS